MEVTSPTLVEDAFFDLKEEDIPPGILDRLKKVVETRSWAKMAARKSKLLLTITARPNDVDNLKEQERKESKQLHPTRIWKEVPSKETVATLLEVPSDIIHTIMMDDTGAKLQVALTETHIPPRTHIMENKIDYRVFVTAINETANVAFVHIFDHTLDDIQDQIARFLCSKWFAQSSNNISAKTQTGSMWRMTRKGHQNVPGLRPW